MRTSKALAVAWLALAACSAGGRGADDGAPAGDTGRAHDAGGGAAARDGAEPASDGGAPATSPDGADDYDGAFVDTKEVDDYLTAQMHAALATGIAVAIVKGGHVGWAKGYGLADISSGRPATPDTLFELASVSKTVVSVALMHLFEDPARGVSLDDDVNAKLPFRVQNPRFPGTAITYRMLLTHTSSLVDGAILDVPPTQGDAPTSLRDWLADAVGRDDAWSSSAPNTTYAYSNTAVSLAGYLVEVISGKNLQDYSATEIFAPLGMTETSFFLRGLDPTHIAQPYEFVNNAFQAQGLYGFPDYPDGQLRTSARQLARFLVMFEQHGALGGTRILSAATVDEMRRLQLPSVAADQGLVWYYGYDGPTRILGHNGAYLGISTDMWFDPATGAGYVLLTNSGAYYDDQAGTSAAFCAPWPEATTHTRTRDWSGPMRAWVCIAVFA
jgi:CubicO group peptidase (beta-lactamase class C family)